MLSDFVCNRRWLALLAILSAPAQAEGLLQLWELALENNPSLKGSEYAVERAKAQQDQARSKLLPSASITGNYSLSDYHQNAGGANNIVILSGSNLQYAGYRTTAQISQALFDLPSYLRLKGAQSATRQSEHEALANRMKLAADLVDRYLKVLEAQDNIAQLQAEQAFSEGQVRRMQHLYERQMTKVTDLYEVEAYQQTLITAAIEANHNRAIELEKLQELTGFPSQDLNPLTQETFPPVKRDVTDWVQEATANNPALVALRFAVESAQKMIASTQAQHLPHAALSVSETYANTGYQNLRYGAYNIGTVAVDVTIPIYSGGGVEAGVRDAVARYQMVREQHEAQRRKVEQETRSAFLNAASSHARIQSTVKEVQFREKAVAAEQKGYELGTVTIVALLDSRRRLHKARSEQFKARYDYIRSIVNLRLQTGSLADQDIESVDAWFARSGY